jgi:hypothetical protein
VNSNSFPLCSALFRCFPFHSVIGLSCALRGEVKRWEYPVFGGMLTEPKIVSCSFRWPLLAAIEQSFAPLFQKRAFRWGVKMDPVIEAVLDKIDRLIPGAGNDFAIRQWAKFLCWYVYAKQ